ncbi:PhzF family phenazine biosynthesis protein [Nocardioides sp. GXZ039]|uniref:PhzF family phenazine biosynthesis protein n=1 Tax=Nocardioides sp. GXZ039 TaxID=3136018 RepID=UPI0030F36FE0
MHRFRQVDVFSAEPLGGNPVAVVHDADDLADDQLAAFARWTNLSETTFLLAPTTPEADYRLRIFTPGGELPFAGHPTLGSAHAWLEAGGASHSDDVVVQECGAGLVRVRRGQRLAFAAPALQRSGPPDDADLDRAVAALRVTRDDVVEAAWIDNGPGWLGLLLRDAEAVLALDPDFARFDELKLGVAGPGGAADLEVRAFCPQYGVPEDPVTGSLNAGLGQWLAGRVLPTSYIAAQGTALQRSGRVHVTAETDGSGEVWVGGDTRTTIEGTLSL